MRIKKVKTDESIVNMNIEENISVTFFHKITQVKKFQKLSAAKIEIFDKDLILLPKQTDISTFTFGELLLKHNVISCVKCTTSRWYHRQNIAQVEQDA